ncbi:MAG: glycosyltransferase family 2 protein, partial [Bacteroidales bacterium]|nr:glycosyltransferase family 2 protein [Bacteroidales bacterium]
MTAIILLNWNGYKDTIECLASLFACVRQDFVWAVVDNGSENESVREITAFLNDKGKDFSVVKQGEAPSSPLKAGQGIVYCLKENYGFAKGNNLGIALVEQLTQAGEKPSHYLLLNNDTLVESDFLEKLETFAYEHPKYVALTPQIRYAEPRNRIWNCGGKMFFGLRKYLYGEKQVEELEKSCHARRGFIDINLITGCALFAKRELLRSEGLLTNRFFFGEEDFDFSLRMQEEGKKMACVLNSVIYHKLGTTHKNFISKKKIYLYYLT